MGTNVILAIGAMMIFGIFLSSSDKLMIGNTQIAEQNEYYLTALSLGQSLIAEAKTKAFDEKSVTYAVSAPESLSAGLGTDVVAETVPSPDTAIPVSPSKPAPPDSPSILKFNAEADSSG